MGKYSLIVVSGFILIFGRMQGSLNSTGERFAECFLTHYAKTEARLVANSVASMSLAKLSEDKTWRAGYAGVNIGEGVGGAAIEDRSTDASLGAGRIRISASARSGAVTDTTVVAAVVPFLPAGVHAGITANAMVTELGNLNVDGRNHDLDGNVIPLEGTLGVSTTETLDQSGASVVGGTVGGTDHVPAHPAHPAVVEENAMYAFPTTPDEVYGYAEGTLKAMAQSGANGGQYATSPVTLTFPLSGVTYVELTNAGVWQAIDFAASSGVLVIHNTWGNAKVKDLNNGTFRGLIIADDIEKIHTTIIGAVIAMTPSPSGNCIGNGTGDVLYSREALHQGSSMASGGNGGVTVVSWLE